MKKSQSRAIKVAEHSLLLTLLFIGLSSVYAVLAFRNFAALTVIMLQLGLTAIPLTLLLRGIGEERAGIERRLVIDLAGASLGAVALVFLQVAALVQWEDYFANFAVARLAVGGGFHQDSAFHVAILQNILNGGVASTGQHLAPFIPYHVLSYYFDAFFVQVFSLDPWESYALLFYAKSSLMLVSVIYFVRIGLRARRRSAFWFLAPVVTLAWAHTWHSVGSHTLWVPMTLLLLLAPWLHGLLEGERVVGPREMAKLTLLVAALTFGKGSIGLAFALIVGLILFFSGRISAVVVLGGLVWVSFLAFWAFISAQATPSNLFVWPIEGLAARLAYVDELVVSLLLLAGLSAIVRSRDIHSNGGIIAGVLLSSLFAIVAVSIWVANNSSDSFYYVSALFAVAIVTVIPLLLLQVRKPLDEPRLGPAVWLVGFAIAVSPVVAEAPIGPYVGLTRPLEIARAADTVTYRWLNADRVESAAVSALRSPTQWKWYGAPIPEGTSLVKRLGQAADSLLEDSEVPKREALLFVPSEAFAELAAFETGPDWAHGMLITAVTGFPLLHGVPSGVAPTYGFHSYLGIGDEVFQKPLNSVSSSSLCESDRAVVVVESLLGPSLRLECSPRGKLTDD